MSVLGSLLKDIISLRKNTANSDVNITTAAVQQLVEASIIALNAGRLLEADDSCKRAIAIAPADEALERLRFEIEFQQVLVTVSKRFPGPDYLAWLEWFHQFFAPETYLEIGVESGQSLKFSKPPTLAVGVDPDFEIVYTQSSWVKLFKMTSDDFFLAQNMQQVFGVEAISMAFIDGPHTFDQALKDFLNIEKHSSTDTVFCCTTFSL